MRPAPSPQRGEGWGEGASDCRKVRPPSPGSLRDPTSPRWGEVEQAARAVPQSRSEWAQRPMTSLSPKWRDRLLYLISPIGLLIVWQLLLVAGIGDRRFVPAPTDIALRFYNLVRSGELEWHIAVTLYRVFLGFLVGSVPGVAIGLFMAMFRPVRIVVDPLIA